MMKAPQTRSGDNRDWSQIKGFNYQPSYGSNGFELWQKFDAAIIDTELARGKRHFPGMNTLRWWHSWDAFMREPKAYADKFEKTLKLAEQHGCVVMPVLFNRWHDSVLDYGGTYADHFLPGSSWVQTPHMFDSFLETLVGAHTDDPRILAWDLCNEPYAYGATRDELPQIAAAETAWLTQLHAKCKALGAAAPITIGVHMLTELGLVNDLCDVLSIHPYWIPERQDFGDKRLFEKLLDTNVAFARSVGKPLIASECCWGNVQDQPRVAGIRYTLGELQKRGIGWTAYLLHHSLIADAHRMEFGHMGAPGNLSFIEADGSLRPGHEVFNEFCQPT